MLSLETMSRAEKIRMMEALWDDLSHDEASLASPEWHGEALARSERFHAAGQATFVDWEAAKRALREQS